MFKMTKLQRISIAVCVFTLSVSDWLLAAESNLWPLSVTQFDEATNETRDWQALGPLFFSTQTPIQINYRGMRPLYLHLSDDHSTDEETTILYPLYLSRRDQESVDWTVFNLINSSRSTDPQSTNAQATAFDVWPIYFSRDSGIPDTSYQALFPIIGTIKSRFGFDRINWMLFPLFLQTEKSGVVNTSTPWPFIKHRKGNGHTGFAIWPLFGHAEKSGDYRNQFYLWPLFYKNESQLGQPVPSVQEGFLPFYTHEQREGSISENFLWPFFGYTRQTAPVPYSENRYFWPLLVQGRGEEHYVNRWAPIYSHSIRKGVDKKWYVWPLLREEQWSADELVQTKHQFFWFLYWSLKQQSASNSQLPAAYKTHVWPLFSAWDNGAGRRQVQFLSPLAEFFPNNEKIRHLYTPLFAIYRYDQLNPEDVRHTLLWNAISWHRTPDTREFHLGPLFSTRRDSTSARFDIGHGLIGMRRTADNNKWQMFLFDFSSKKSKLVPSSAK